VRFSAPKWSVVSEKEPSRGAMSLAHLPYPSLAKNRPTRETPDCGRCWMPCTDFRLVVLKPSAVSFLCRGVYCSPDCVIAEVEDANRMLSQRAQARLEQPRAKLRRRTD
jgi:hypothetical protein